MWAVGGGAKREMERSSGPGSAVVLERLGGPGAVGRPAVEVEADAVEGAGTGVVGGDGCGK